MDIEKCKKLALDTMNIHGLLDSGWKLKLMRSKTCVGKCSHKFKTIFLSRDYIECNSEKEIYNTILHEIAHALRPAKEHHSKEWRELFIKIGGNGRIKSDARMPKGKYSYKCPKCDTRYEKYRGKLTTYICRNCSTKNKTVVMILIKENL